jgi:subfamily B ATP-binding cassette protein MsbA
MRIIVWVKRLLPGVPCLLKEFRSEKRLLARFLLTSIGRTVTAMAVIYFIQAFLYRVLATGSHQSSGDGHEFERTTALGVVVGLLLAAYVLGGLFSYDNKMVQQRLIKRLEMGIMERLIRHLLKLSVPFVDSQSPGDLIQAVRQDIVLFRKMIHAMANILIEGLLVVGLVAVVIWLSPRLSFWAFVAFPLVSLPLALVARRIREKSFEIRKTGYVFFDIILQIMSGVRVLKAFRAEEREAQITIEKGNVYFDEMIESVRLQSIGQVMLESLAGLGVVAVIIIGSFQVLAGALDVPRLFAFLMAARTLHGPIYNIYLAYMEIQAYAASVSRITEMLQTTPRVCEAPNAVPLPGAPQHIVFRDVRFAYDKGEVLKSISFDVRVGQTVGIVGPSGAGKSTLLSLVGRFYDPTSGEILFDGRRLDHLRLDDVYAQIAIVTQDPFLFAANVRENIRYGRPEATDAEVEEAGRAAYVHEEILNLPQGYDTPIGMNGRALSRGQAQRINLARAFLKRASIVLLDEPTSSLDTIAEAEVQCAMEDLVKGRTSFVITHRFSGLRSVDLILVLKDGNCVGFGPPDELYQECTLYREMYEAQRLEEVRGVR